MEKRRDVVRPAPLKIVVAAVLVVAAATAARACEPPPVFTPQGRVESSGVVVAFHTVPATIVIGRHFSIEAFVCADDGTPALMRIDAVMPEHRHGMNYRPTLDAKGNGHYVAEGFLFHMPGRWQLLFDVERCGRRTRLTSDVLLE